MDGRVRSDQGLDDPEADVCEAPDADLLGLPTADEQPLRRDRNGAHNEESHAAEQDQPQVTLDPLRSRHDPLVALDAGEHAKVGIPEVKQGLQRSAEDVLPSACRCRQLERCCNRRPGRAGRDVRDRRCQASDRRMRVDVLHRYRRQVSALPHSRAEWAMTNESAPSSSKKWLSTDTRSTRRTSASTSAKMLSRLVVSAPPRSSIRNVDSAIA